MIQFSDAFNGPCGQTWTDFSLYKTYRSTGHTIKRPSTIPRLNLLDAHNRQTAPRLHFVSLSAKTLYCPSSVTSFKWMNPAECDAAFAAPFLMLRISRLLAIAERDPKKIAVLLWKQLDFSHVSESSHFPAFFLNISSRLGALRQTLIDESVCLVAGILATSPLTDTQTHTCAHAFTNLAFSFSLSSNN